MSIEDNIFKKTIIDFDKLIDYGFKKENGIYLYSKLILDNTFKVIVEIDINKKIKGKIIDLSLNEEYSSFRIENYIGEFVNKIKCEFERILEDIRDNCCIKNYFIFEQANRITNFIISKYNNKPEFLWKKYSNYGVFKKTNGKWYAIIMNISRNKIDKGTDEVEIINVKMKEEKIIELLAKNGFYRAYHMNKKNWISIILDDTLEDNEIMNYIVESYSLAN